MDNVVEEVARAICLAELPTDKRWELCVPAAEAAIRAFGAAYMDNDLFYFMHSKLLEVARDMEHVARNCEDKDARLKLYKFADIAKADAHEVEKTFRKSRIEDSLR